MKFFMKHFLILILFYATYSKAECVRTTTTPTTMIRMYMGTVVVSPNLNVGDVIKQSSWSVGDTGDLFTCTTGSILTASINTALLTNNSDKIHQTNIPGVGMKLQRVSASGNSSATYPYMSTRSSSGGVYLTAGFFVMTLYKTDSYVGSGPLTSGTYSWYSPQGGGLAASGLNSYLNENDVVIVSPSCIVLSGAQQNVYLEPVNFTQLKTVGSTAGDTNFSIQLKCSGGASLNVGYDNIELTFTGTTPSSLTNSNGVLINEVESTGAQGVGVQVLDNTKKTLTFEQAYTVGSLAGPVSTFVIDTNYIARYYRYGATISPGNVEAKLIFGITYD